MSARGKRKAVRNSYSAYSLCRFTFKEAFFNLCMSDLWAVGSNRPKLSRVQEHQERKYRHSNRQNAHKRTFVDAVDGPPLDGSSLPLESDVGDFGSRAVFAVVVVNDEDRDRRHVLEPPRRSAGVVDAPFVSEGKSTTSLQRFGKGREAKSEKKARA